MAGPERRDVLVIGGGPAGAAVAIRAARGGARVTVFEKGERGRDKVCGDGLTPRAVRALAELGVPLDGAHRIDGLRMVANSTVRQLDWPGIPPFPAHGAVWPRRRLDARLMELAEEAGEDRRSRAPRRGIALAVVGVVVMGLGGNLAIRGASRVVDSLGVTDSAVGLTALALATTAELFALAFAAVRRDVPEVAVAGVVGSAVYNATVSLGVAALVHPLRVGGVLGAAVAAAVLPLAVVVLSARGRLTRPAGAVLVAGYAAFLLVVLVGT